MITAPGSLLRFVFPKMSAGKSSVRTGVSAACVPALPWHGMANAHYKSMSYSFHCSAVRLPANLPPGQLDVMALHHQVLHVRMAEACADLKSARQNTGKRAKKEACVIIMCVDLHGTF